MAQLSKDGDEQRKKNHETAVELEALQKENELLRLQVIGNRAKAFHPSSGSQSRDMSSMLLSVMNFPNLQAAASPGSTNIHDTISLISELSSIDHRANNFLMNPNQAAFYLGQVQEQYCGQYPFQLQDEAAANLHLNTPGQMSGLLSLLPQFGPTSNCNLNSMQLEGFYGLITRIQSQQALGHADATQLQHLMELLHQSKDRNKR